ncbi:MAG: FHA domain-containing protein [Acidimicrobiia bacterium]
MPVITLTLAKIGLMVLLYLFLFWVFRVVGKEVRDTTEPAKATPDLALAHLPRLSIVEPRQYRGWTMPLRHDLVIGRGDDCGLQLQDPHASSHHARVTARGDDFFIEDTGSTNGTYVNRRRIGEPTRIRRGDNVQVGQTVMEVAR